MTTLRKPVRKHYRIGKDDYSFTCMGYMQPEATPPLGRPKRLIKFNGLEIPAYPSSSIQAILGISEITHSVREKQGLIPPAMWRRQHRKYYSIWEVKSLFDLVALHGRPVLTPNSRSKEFIEIWHKKWAEIRENLLAGKVPDIPVYLRYESREELQAVVASFLASKGHRSTQLAEDFSYYLFRKALEM